MKNKRRNLYESQGIIDKDGVQCNNLADLLTEYIYDLKYGLNSDPFYNGDECTITKNTIESYYQYIHSKKMPDYIIPDWIGAFNIHLVPGKISNGKFLQSGAKLDNNNKLVFTIEVKNSMDSPDSLCNTFVHEFQHAYSAWIQLTKNIYFHNRKSTNMYMYSTNAFGDEKYGSQYHPMILQKFSDYVEVNDEIFTNPMYLERTLLMGFYYSDLDETRSFIQEFANDIMHQIKSNIKTIKDEIRESLKFKGDFNNITPEEQYRSNILNNLSITCYDSKYYKIYKSYYIFYKKLQKMNIDQDVAESAVKGASRAIKIFLEIPLTKKLVKIDEDENKILNKIAQKQIPVYDKVLKKMQKIFVKLIMEIPI